MTIAQRYDTVLAYFATSMPNADTELVFRDDYELLVAVILSAQCTDKRVNMVTPALFQRWPDVESLAKADEADVFAMIATVTYPNSKCRYLVQMARMVMDIFGGQIPRTREDLMRLPGVGRKTANVMLIVAFGVPAMPVDTHVHRVAARLGLTVGCKSPEQTERQLLEHIPARLLAKAHHWLILFGRYTCTALNPHCADCALASLCLRLHPEQGEEVTLF
ncbi:MAG: endonuclease III [Bacteroidales bacterium]|nr:endonuclease III [Bacteroidales bacterium]MDD7725693.1 endonuclease III [Bacteroidales bacterium]MDY4175115.1 endonuclease III [Bacteroidales bacterium]